MSASRLSARAYRRLRSLVHPRALRDRVKALAARLGLLPWYWRARERGRALRRGVSPTHIGITRGAWRGLRAAQAARRAETRLTIAVDVTAFWEPLTGIGWYLYRLLEALAERDDVRLRLYGPDLIDTDDLPAPVVPLPEGPALELVRYCVPQDVNVGYVRAVEWLRGRQDRLIADDGNRVLFAPNYFLPPRFHRADGRLVATVHDLGFRRVPWTLRDSTRASLERHLDATLARAAAVITDSETVRGEMIEAGLIAPARIVAVPLAPGLGPVGADDDDAAADAAPLPADAPRGAFVLHVGTIEPRKNLAVLLDAWPRLDARRAARGAAPIALVLVGRTGWKAETIDDAIATGVADGWLHRFGYLDTAAVQALYRAARLVVLPSIYEGFGLPA
ncbi:MAG: glycosyltransferase family 1 protein, partial [Acidobacteriota bacterium]